jgi:type IV pilus assembly protein PilO
LADLSLSKLPWKTQVAMFVVLSIAGAGAYVYFIDMPARARIAARTGELARLRVKIDTGLETARQLPEFRRKAADLQARLESLKPQLPEQKDAADLLRRVHGLAVESNLTIRGFKPQAIATRELHAEWPISLELEGTYHDLGMFLDRVSRFPRIINVSGLAITGRTEQPATRTIAVTCTATTFVLLDPEALAATQPKKAAKRAPTRTS